MTQGEELRSLVKEWRERADVWQFAASHRELLRECAAQLEDTIDLSPETDHEKNTA